MTGDAGRLRLSLNEFSALVFATGSEADLDEVTEIIERIVTDRLAAREPQPAAGEAEDALAWQAIALSQRTHVSAMEALSVLKAASGLHTSAEVAQREAEAWDAAVQEADALGWLHDYAHTDMLARNPHRADRIAGGQT